MTAFFRLLLATTASLLSIAIADPESPAAAAIAAAQTYYEELRVEYEAAKCNETWGTFPQSFSDSVEIKPEGFRASKLCKCGLLYDEARAHAVTEEEITAGLAIDGVIPSVETTSAAMNIVQSWVLAREAVSSKVPCSGGMAGGYPCKNVDLLAHLPPDSQAKKGNDLWGWTKGTREFVIWGVQGGHYFVEVTDGNLVVLGYMRTPDRRYNQWHDVKVIGNYAYMGCELWPHGMQVFDLRRLLDVDLDTDCKNSKFCQRFEPDALYEGDDDNPVDSSHNIVVNEESETVFIVGMFYNNGGLHMVDVSNPLNPTFAGAYEDDGYTHDAQCVIYRGPDSRYRGREICFCYNADTVTIVDVTNRSNPQQLSRTAYATNEYTHQGWLSTDQSHIVFGDEGDEGRVGRTRTMVFDVSDLRKPDNWRQFLGRTAAIDHNQYIKEIEGVDYIFQGNYQAGLQILRVNDYDAADFEEVAYFDIYPSSDDTSFNGVWSVYPYFASGIVAISGVSEGLFLVRPTELLTCRFKDRKVTFQLVESGEFMTCADLDGLTRVEKRLKCREDVVFPANKRVFTQCKESCGRVGKGRWCRHLDVGGV